MAITRILLTNFLLGLLLLGGLIAIEPPATIASGSTTNSVNELKVNAPSPAVSSEPEVANQKTSDEAETNDQDWWRIFVVVLLLLVVAGGFYALSRAFNEPDDAIIADKSTGRKRGRPRKDANTSLPKRPRGRPRQS